MRTIKQPVAFKQLHCKSPGMMETTRAGQEKNKTNESANNDIHNENVQQTIMLIWDIFI